MRNLFFLLALILGWTSLFAQTPKQVKFFSDKKNSFIKYSMSHPLHSWTGESKDFNSVILANENKMHISQVAVSAKISTFDSKNANRDSHMMEVTDAIRFPSVTFASKSVKDKGNNKLLVSGVLTFHGVSKNISFEADEKKSGKSLEVDGGFSINITDYNIERPSLMGMATDDEIKMEFKVVY